MCCSVLQCDSACVWQCIVVHYVVLADLAHADANLQVCCGVLQCAIV